jgi:hypothetical protein
MLRLRIGCGEMTPARHRAATRIITDDTTIPIIAIYRRIKLLTVDNCVVSMGRRGLAAFCGASVTLRSRFVAVGKHDRSMIMMRHSQEFLVWQNLIQEVERLLRTLRGCTARRAGPEPILPRTHQRLAPLAILRALPLDPSADSN